MMTVSSNDLVLLEQVPAQRQEQLESPMLDDKAFELFSCEQALFSQDIASDELADGVVGVAAGLKVYP